MPINIGIGLAMATMLYAVMLEHYKHYLEPDWTWIEVVVGTLLCVTAAGIAIRLTPNASWPQYEQQIIASFGIGGGVIITWQVWRMIKRRQQTRAVVFDLVNGDHQERDVDATATTPLAERGERTSTRSAGERRAIVEASYPSQRVAQPSGASTLPLEQSRSRRTYPDQDRPAARRDRGQPGTNSTPLD
ncbi:hypothetical protein [Herpetosiphon llansteffanensis]|uniref:hypothetical protein n=1 Tax=Herpetosiphon llansteffanensis TaxID=2094568 RepID=UPI000D7BABA5|nr:hypothetical protein [Herpetosiphon llansteffanensis]